jgi:hypothetical protein
VIIGCSPLSETSLASEAVEFGGTVAAAVETGLASDALEVVLTVGVALAAI